MTTTGNQARPHGAHDLRRARHTEQDPGRRKAQAHAAACTYGRLRAAGPARGASALSLRRAAAPSLRHSSGPLSSQIGCSARFTPEHPVPPASGRQHSRRTSARRKAHHHKAPRRKTHHIAKIVTAKLAFENAATESAPAQLSPRKAPLTEAPTVPLRTSFRPYVSKTYSQRRLAALQSRQHVTTHA